MRFLVIFTYLTTGIFTFLLINEAQFQHWDLVKNAPDALYYPVYKIIAAFLVLLGPAFAINPRPRIAASFGLICLLALSGWWLEAIEKSSTFNLTAFSSVNVLLWLLIIAGYLGAILLSLGFMLTTQRKQPEAR